jgi:UDP-N-acetylglucosamine 2-epimerase (non-hydrolysing)
MILITFGTRQEWIKIKPILETINGKIPFKVLCIGQHGPLIDSSIKQYQVSYLKLNNSSNRLDSIVTSILSEFDKYSNGITHVMVQGDTTYAFGLALAAFNRKIKIVHLEAGARSWNKDNPYPEEFNRISVAAMTDIHLCTTRQNKDNLRYTMSHNSKAYVVGNTMLDNLINEKPSISNTILVVMNNKENLPILDQWFNSINNLAINNPLFEFVFPMNLNPEIQKHKHILKNVKVMNPLTYEQQKNYLSTCGLLITDNINLQEEVAFLKKKSILCGTINEWVEGEYIFAYICQIPDMLQDVFNSIKIELVNSHCPYGDGKASKKIFEILETWCA